MAGGLSVSIVNLLHPGCIVTHGIVRLLHPEKKLRIAWRFGFFFLSLHHIKCNDMTVKEMRRDIVKRISQLDNGDERIMRPIWLYISSALPDCEEGDLQSDRREKAKQLAHSFLGAFAKSREERDWKEIKEECLSAKYSE